MCPLLSCFFAIVDLMTVTECLADTALCDHETLGVHVAGGLVVCLGSPWLKCQGMALPEACSPSGWGGLVHWF